MAKTLLIHYKHAASLHWSLIDELGKPATPPAPSTLEELAPVAKDTRATVLLDSSLLYFDVVNIPGNNRSQQLRAAPFALEEKLASDIEQLHFVLGKRLDDGRIPVVCVDKTLLRNIVQKFADAGVDIEMLLPDVLALPHTDNHWTLLFDAGTVHIKTSAQTGFFFDRDNFSFMLPALLEQHGAPQAMDGYCTATDTPAINLPAESAITLNTHSYEHTLTLFADNLRDARAMNLLQGEFAVKRKTGFSMRAWRAAAAIGAVWLILQLLVAAVEIRQLEQKNLELTAAVENEFKTIFPDAKKFSGMQARVKKRLEELKGGDGAEEIFLPIMTAAGPILAAEGVSIRALAYREKHIDLELQASSLQTLDNAKTKLDALQGIKTTLSTSMEKDKITGRLRLEHQG
jgi:general secretion pathway protein L